MQRQKTWILAGMIGLMMGLGGPQAQADDSFTFVIKRQEEKKKTRWTLADWLNTRDKMRMQDLWLALHSPTPYEFYFGGDYTSSDASPGGRTTYGSAYFAAYARIFGLELNAEFQDPAFWEAIFHLRVFGFHQQSTNITFDLGLRNRTNPAQLRNALAGVSLSIYLFKNFGLDGIFRHIFESTPNASGQSFSGSRFQGGAFIDFSFLRIYGNYFSEPETIRNNGVVSSEVSNTGTEFGLRFYF